jgi:hypothetical protein
MRAPKLIVRYMKFPPATDGAAFLGVFSAEDDLNSVFAEAEPVTHDEWNADSMEDRNGRTFIRTALRRIEESVAQYLAPSSGTPGDGAEALPLARMSRLLGEAFPDIGGTGASVQLLPGSQPTSSSRRKAAPTVQIDETPMLSLEEGRPVAKIAFRIKTPPNHAPFRFRCEPRVITSEGGAERDAPVGADVPEVVRWELPDHTVAAVGDQIEVAESSDIEGSVLVSVPVGSAVAVNLARVQG